MKKIQETIEDPPIEVLEQRERKRSRTPQPVIEPSSVEVVAKPVVEAPVVVEKAAPVVKAPAPVAKAPEPVVKVPEAAPVVQVKPTSIIADKADTSAPAKKKEGK